jgi:two-component system KDP operon response regulator KdpE
MTGSSEAECAQRALVLVVEDDTLIRRLIGIQLSGLPVDVVEAASGAAALAACARRVPALALVDMGLPDIDGAELCAEIRRRYPGTPVCIVSGASGASDRRLAADAGCAAYLIKPFAAKELQLLVTRLLASSAS